MKLSKALLLVTLCAFGIIISCTQNNKPQATAPAGNSTDEPSDFTDEGGRFPDFGYMVPGYKGPVFRLSQDYPTALPTGKLPDFFNTDFRTDWRKYLEQVQAYCFEGNTDVDFRVEQNKVRSWYHMPWQHYGPSGREGFHGLTQEAPVKAFQLASTQTIDTSGAVAVGFYNDVAGYTIGEVWKNHYAPDGSKNVAFKNGAVLFKILFVTLPENVAAQQVPWLTNGIWWDGYVVSNFDNMAKPDPANYRHKTKVVLVQMDIMVRDDRAPHGWVFGNFQYNGAMNKPNKWQNLVPVGLMWGEDPENNTNASNPTPTKTIINPDLKETIINPDTKELPATHLGWNSRLNGPVDNPMSSCYSCHATAEYPQLALMSPLFNPDTLKNNPPGSAGWMRWFQNLQCGQPFTPEAKSMDFSLQLAIAFQNFNDWKYQQAGLYDSSYRVKRNLKGAPQAMEATATQPAKPKVIPIAFPY